MSTSSEEPGFMAFVFVAALGALAFFCWPFLMWLYGWSGYFFNCKIGTPSLSNNDWNCPMHDVTYPDHLISQRDMDCARFDALLDYYKKTYGHPLPENFYPPNDCLRSNPFAEKQKVHGDGIIFNVMEEKSAQEYIQGTIDRMFVFKSCSSLPCHD